MEVEGLSQLGCRRLVLSNFADPQGHYMLLLVGESYKMKMNCWRRLLCLMSNQEQPFIAIKCWLPLTAKTGES